jgi:hypothetical protein
MRVGFNPNKNQSHNESDYFHQIVIPVYIPNQEGYFKDSLQILQLCLSSLFKTSHNKTYVTIINNGSCAVIVDYLNELYQQNKIQELIHTVNIGKLNAILKGIVGNNFPLISISDADVLFLNNWQEASYAIFESFPQTAAVCPTPSSRSLRTHTANIYWDLFFSSTLNFSKVFNPEALLMFGHSVGDSDFYNKTQLEKYLTVTKGKIKAVIGAGHFVSTYRGEVFSDLKNRYSKYKLGGDSESEFLDRPVVKKGFWRLSTADNYAYHLGNVLEDWMQVELDSLQVNTTESDFVLKKVKSGSLFFNFIKNKLFSKFILNKKIIRYFLVWKGLSREEAKTYLK